MPHGRFVFSSQTSKASLGEVESAKSRDDAELILPKNNGAEVDNEGSCRYVANEVPVKKGDVDPFSMEGKGMSAASDVNPESMKEQGKYAFEQEDDYGKQYNWMFALAFPKSSRKHPKREMGISHWQAKRAFNRCFRGEDCKMWGHSTQASRFYHEREEFLKAFDRLPEAQQDAMSIGTGYLDLIEEGDPTELEKGMRKYIGATKDFHGGAPENFLELMRNVVITKLVLHCKLTTRLCYTEDHQHILALITCEQDDLLQEGDNEMIDVELDIRNVDPPSLEPCTRTFYPLLHWFFRHSPEFTVRHKGLIDAYYSVIAMFDGLSEQEKVAYAAEATFWLDVKAAVDTLRGCKGDATKIWTSESGRRVFRVHKKKSRHNFDAENHVGSARKMADLANAFAEYMMSKAKRGLRAHPSELIKQINRDLAKRGKRMRLKNLYTTLGTKTMSPFMTLNLKSYLESEGRECLRFPTALRKKDQYFDVIFRPCQRLRLLKSIIDRQMDLEKLEHEGICTAFFPLDERAKIETIRYDEDGQLKKEPSRLLKAWGWQETSGVLANFFAFIRTLSPWQPLGEIRDYYGEQIAFYFALVQMLVVWLLLPGAIGIAVLVIQLWQTSPEPGTAGGIRAWSDVIYSFIVVTWGTAFLEFWKRRQKEQSLLWGMVFCESKEIGRPKYYGTNRRSPVDYDDEDIYFPNCYDKRFFCGRLPRQVMSYVVLLVLAACEISLVFSILDWRGRESRKRNLLHSWDPMLLLFPVLISSLVSVFGILGRWVARKLNNWENYKSPKRFLNNLICKVFLFEFINRYGLFIYIALFKAQYEHRCMIYDEELGYAVNQHVEEGVQCMAELVTVVQSVFVTLALMNAVELLMPVLMPWIRNKATQKAPKTIAVHLPGSLQADAGPGQEVPQDWDARMSHIVQDQMEKEPYGELEVDGSFDDYAEVVILFGYVTLFSVVFPLAPLIAMLLLILEMRVDGLKLFVLVRRPMPHSADSIGGWLVILEVLSWFSVVFNALLLVSTFGTFDNHFGDAPRPLYLFALMLCFCGAKVLVGVLVPDISESVSTLEEHHRFVKENLKTGSKGMQSRKDLGLAQLNLQIDDADSGQFRDPQDFAISREHVARRVRLLQNRQAKKDVGRSPSLLNRVHMPNKNFVGNNLYMEAAAI
eukprot:gnl/MRDRNA2_/MRDRNA2_70237_c0_seq1.p1 gnl/MRDRNA2_/MRDRNA2_70237_c0~~gnl/MRDRNA2_/MRDRNA2_70237_c0_seq1.p1  ORF type:complete len:1293 (+),score=231.25 gnl/MRDRNA2_/MRDRNA2_70237_c0_seq1:411-3881(+)